MITLEQVCRDVCRTFGVDMKMLRSPDRHRVVARPRQIAMYLIRTCTDLSFNEIGAAFGGRDHSTAMAAVAKVESTLKRDVELRRTITAIENRLLQLEPTNA